MRKLIVVLALLAGCGSDPSAPVVTQRDSVLILKGSGDPWRPSWGDSPSVCYAKQHQWIVCDGGFEARPSPDDTGFVWEPPVGR